MGSTVPILYTLSISLFWQNQKGRGKGRNQINAPLLYGSLARSRGRASVCCTLFLGSATIRRRDVSTFRWESPKLCFRVDVLHGSASPPAFWIRFWVYSNPSGFILLNLTYGILFGLPASRLGVVVFLSPFVASDPATESGTHFPINPQ